ncbi:hypothetical protein V5O48_014216 [Marasmius crinis-equi]|uniref:Alpha-type protein kinase domain-containing protein n=1 Tax=Marasmius crinis-equi TaxID=585013 RepID=A0ABR3EY99_9AGAR
MDTKICVCCQKLSKAGITPLEIAEIMAKIACNQCSSLWDRLPDGQICGHCRARRARRTQAPTADPTSHIAQETLRHEKKASEKRLAGKPNTNLTKAVATKEQKAHLREVKKSEQVVLDCVLFFVASNQTGRKAAPTKSPMAPLRKPFAGSENAKNAIDTMLAMSKSAWFESPHFDKNLFYRFEHYSVGHSNTNHYHLNLDQLVDDLTLDKIFRNFIEQRYLTTTHQNQRSIPLRFTITTNESYASDSDAEYIDPEPGSPAKKSKYGRKRVLSSPTNQKDAKRYKSNWRLDDNAGVETPRDSPVEEVTHELHVFRKFTCVVDQYGQPTVKMGDEDEYIEIHKGWLLHAAKGKRGGGYTAKGLTKYVFEGRNTVKTNLYAIACYKPDFASNGENHDNLLAKLNLTHIGAYLLESFKDCCKLKNIKIPDIKWNLGFMGRLIANVTFDPANDHESESGSLYFTSFLVSPLLPVGKDQYTERKFSGNGQAGVNTADVLGLLMDAYAHHTLDDTSGFLVFVDLQGIEGLRQSLTLFDPQAHSKTRKLGPWDNGINAITEFAKDHKCNTYCKKLELKSASDLVPKGNPQRIGF